MKNCWSTDFCPAFSEVSIPLNKRLAVAVAGEREVKDQPWQELHQPVADQEGRGRGHSLLHWGRPGCSLVMNFTSHWDSF